MLAASIHKFFLSRQYWMGKNCRYKDWTLCWQMADPCPPLYHPPFTSCLSVNCVNVWMYLTISYWFQRGLMDSNKVLCYPGVGQLHQQAPTAPVCSRRGPLACSPLLRPSVLTDRCVHGVRSPYRQIEKRMKTYLQHYSQIKQNETDV